MCASRVTASASMFAKMAPRLIPQNTVGWVCARHASPKPSNDEQTLAKSADTLGALLGSTVGLNNTSTALPGQTSTPVVSASSTADMFVPPAQDALLGYIAALIQRHGHRARAARTVSRMLLNIHTFTHAPPAPIVREAVMAAAPAVRVVSFKYGTKVMATPHPLTEKQRVRAALKSIIAASESRPGKTLDVRLAREMIAVVQGESRSLGEKERIHKLAMVNRGNLRR